MNLAQTLKFLHERNLTVFTPEFHILVLHPNMTQVLSLNNNLDHICHLLSPFSLPTLFFDGSALHVDLVCQRTVTRSAGSSATGCTGNLVARNAVCLGPGGIGNSSVVVAMCLAIECNGCSAGGTEHFVVVGLANHHPSPLLYFYKRGNLVPIHISLLSALVPQQIKEKCGWGPNFPFCKNTEEDWDGDLQGQQQQNATAALGIAVLWGCASTFIVQVDVGVGGIGKSFLDSNKFSDAAPVFGHEVSALAGIFSSCGGLLSAEEPPWDGFSWSFPFAKFIIVIGMIMGICMFVLSALGVGACTGLATTHTLHHLVGINLLLLSFVFVPILAKGLVLGCTGLG